MDKFVNSQQYDRIVFAFGVLVALGGVFFDFWYMAVSGIILMVAQYYVSQVRIRAKDQVSKASSLVSAIFSTCLLKSVKREHIDRYVEDALAHEGIKASLTERERYDVLSLLRASLDDDVSVNKD